MTNREKFLINKAKKQVFIYEYLRANPCVDCGESDPIVLEFDHIYTKGHRISLSSMSMNRLIAEVAKCQIRCANCHCRRHRRRVTNESIEAMIRGNLSVYQLVQEEVFAKQQRRKEKAQKAGQARWAKHREQERSKQ